MNLSEKELQQEKDYLDNCTKLIKDYLSELGQDLYEKEEKIQEFKKYIWDNKSQLDPTELKSLMSDNDIEVFLAMEKGKYFQKLYKIQSSPYFGSIVFEEDQEKEKNIYLGITHLEDKNKNYLIYDWRAPISSLFYDYEIGKCSYKAPSGFISGNLKRKRQYKIENGKIKHIFDNSINIDDSLLQEVLSKDSSDKMKNIVNTIQQEQNKIIRNVEDKNLIVQGIAGSGKTSVALHRIAFLLYKIENLTSNNILIFSPNNVFSEYISNVLPELGEDNPSETTYSSFLTSCIKEYKEIETFTEFISRYYTYKEKNPNIVKYKQSDGIIEDLDNYINSIEKNARITKDIEHDKNIYDKDTLNRLLERYSKFPLFMRITEASKKLSEINYDGKRSHAKSFERLLLDGLNIEKKYKKIYHDFFISPYCKVKLTEQEIKSFINNKKINYEDAIIFSYIKGKLQGFNYNSNIKQIVIDEAQDYTLLQYKILNEIFKRSSWTILGDINQTINPYYKYDDLNKISSVINNNTRYLELTKTYRSSARIIEYTNNILGLKHISAIRKDNEKPVLFRKENNLKKQLLNDINYLRSYKSCAIITKDDREAEEIYELLKDDIGIGKITQNEEVYRKDLIVVPSYMAKGLEFDSVIVYNKPNNKYKNNEKYLYYVACTRSQHELIIYN